jgi:peptidoglycan/xylan/chitin deacetylase (PgdA/CDA1 family)
VGLGSLGRIGLRALNRALPGTQGGLSVLGYHLVGGGSRAPVDLPKETFRRQLDELSECGEVVSLEAGLERLEQSDDETHLIALTFDDAYANFYDEVWPLLQERELPATLYVPVGFVDGSSPAPLAGAERLPPMSWSQLEEISRCGLVTLGSHSSTHPDLRRLSETECLAELSGSRARLEQQTGRAPTSFCYPRALWSPAVGARVASLYASAVVGGGRRNRLARLDRSRIWRLPLRRDLPASLSKLLRAEVWLEEWVASRIRELAS